MKRHSPRSASSTSAGRRTVLKGFAGAAALAGFGGTALAQQSKEAPALAKLVSDKKLPPLAQRLGSAPMVVQVDKVGVYGGALRRGLRGSSDHNGILRMVGNQGLVRWNMAFTEVLPCVASKWEVNANSTEFTFTLRPGMKWSDGKPFGADDILFSIEDCAKNAELYKSVPSTLVIANKPVVVTKVNDSTVKFTFASPYALFLEQLATPLGQYPTLFPKHYCSQFHPKYNPKAAEQAKAANLSDWAALFRNKCGDIEIPARWGNTEKPTLDPWVVTEAYSGGVTRVVMERNPYFWQVDQTGQQLPYIDKLNFSIAQDVESLMLDALSGKLDIQERHIDSLQNKPTLSQNMKKGDYRLIELINAGAQQVQIYLNLTHKDAKMREMFGNKQFRQALSLGMNRKEIIELVYLGQSEPFQTGPRPGHPWFNEKLSRQFTQFDPKQANEILDKIGYAKRDGQNFRLRPDGQKVFFSIDVIPTLYPDAVDTLELVKRHWEAIGVDMKVNTIERALYYTRGDSNDHDAATWPGPGGLDPMLDPRDYFAQHIARHPLRDSMGDVVCVRWQGRAGAAREPEAAHEAVRRGARDGRPEEARRTDEAGFRPGADAFETIGVCLAVNSFGICKNNLQNVPKSYPSAWSWPNPGPALPQQFFFTRT